MNHNQDNNISSGSTMTPAEFRQLGIIERVRHIETLLHLRIKTKDIKESLALTRYNLSHLLRLSKALDHEVKNIISRGRLSEGHARAIARLPGHLQDKFTRDCIQKRWSVRKIEMAVKAELAGVSVNADADYYNNLAELIGEQIGHPVTINADPSKAGQGTIEITYLGLEAFEGILQRMRVRLPDDDW